MKNALPHQHKLLYTNPMVMTGRRGLVRNVISTALFMILTSLFGLVPVLVNAQSATTTATTTDTSATTTISITATTTIATSTASNNATSTTPVATTTPPVINSNVGIEAQVRTYFANTPVMVAIASCESSFREFNSSGMPLNGGSGGMIGIFQISSAIHAPIALSMGMDINTVAGNMAYANYLYQHDGTTPWLSSFPCWRGFYDPTTSDDRDKLEREGE